MEAQAQRAFNADASIAQSRIVEDAAVVLKYPASNFALSATGLAGGERRGVRDVVTVMPFCQHMLQEELGDVREEAAIIAKRFVLAADNVLDPFPRRMAG